MRNKVKPDCVLREPDIVCLANFNKYARQRQKGYEMVGCCIDGADRRHSGSHAPKCYLGSR